jgi:hypothetical protein
LSSSVIFTNHIQQIYKKNTLRKSRISQCSGAKKVEGPGMTVDSDLEDLAYAYAYVIRGGFPHAL